MLETDNLNQLNALVSLIDEPNEEIFNEIKTKIISYGTQAIPLLQDSWVNTFGTLHAWRLESTIEEIRFNKLVALVIDWLETEEKPTTCMLHMAAKYINENYEQEAAQKWIDRIQRDCWLELNEDLTPLEKINILNHIVYKVHAISSYLPNQNQLLGFFPDIIHNTKKASALAIGFIYLSIAQKLKISLRGINLPNQFVLAYLDDESQKAQLNDKDIKQNNILFYINPSNSGAVFTKKEIADYLNFQGIKSVSEHYLPCARKTMARILFSELTQCLHEENRHTKGSKVLDLVQIINARR